jgi:hypothetical protein
MDLCRLFGGGIDKPRVTALALAHQLITFV